MNKSTLLDAVRLLKTGDLTQKATANEFLSTSIEHFSDKVVVELISLLANKDSKADAKKLLLSFAHYAWFHGLYGHYSNAEVKLVKLLADKDCSGDAEEILTVYLERDENYLKHPLSSEAQSELVSLLVQADCPQVAQNFFWAYIDYHTLGCWYIPYYRNLSADALTKLVGYLHDKAYRKTANDILLRYLDNCRGYHGYNGNRPSHSFLPKHEVELICLLKKEECRDMAKKLLTKYFNSHRIRLSKRAEVTLILLLWKKEYREIAKELLLNYAKYHHLYDVSNTWFDKLYMLAGLFKTKACKEELAYFQIELQAA